MNPIIYASSSRDFKRAFLKVLRFRWVRGHYHHNMDGTYMHREFKSLRKSSYVHKEFGSNCATVHVQKEKSSCDSTRDTNSPVKSLLVYQDRRKISSPSPNHDISKKSSYSDLADEDYDMIQLTQLDCVPKHYSAIV